MSYQKWSLFFWHHLPIFSTIFENYNNQIKNVTITFREKKSKNIEKFKENLWSVNWTLIEDNIDPVHAYTELYDTYANIYNNCFPIRTIKSNSKICKPCISKGLRRSINKKNKLYIQFLQNRITESKYKIYKNKLTHSIRIAKRIYLSPITPRFQPFTLCVCGWRFVFLVHYTIARMSSFSGQCERLSRRLVPITSQFC